MNFVSSSPLKTSSKAEQNPPTIATTNRDTVVAKNGEIPPSRSMPIPCQTLPFQISMDPITPPTTTPARATNLPMAMKMTKAIPPIPFTTLTQVGSWGFRCSIFPTIIIWLTETLSCSNKPVLKINAPPSISNFTVLPFPIVLLSSFILCIKRPLLFVVELAACQTLPPGGVEGLHWLPPWWEPRWCGLSELHLN